MGQIENEYGAESKAYGAAGHAYLTWAAKMAVGLDTGVPWVMCKQDDAPDPIVCIFLYFMMLPILLVIRFVPSFGHEFNTRI